MTEQTLDERVAYLEENIEKLNKAATDTAIAMKQLLNANKTNGEALSGVLQHVLDTVCPFPPGCDL
ncbi:MAG: hypothetical protein ABJB97_03250 [Acidobacteriota bacterium]